MSNNYVQSLLQPMGDKDVQWQSKSNFFCSLYQPRQGTLMEPQHCYTSGHANPIFKKRMCPNEGLNEATFALATRARDLLVGYINGTTGLYPPAYVPQIPTTLDSSEDTAAWLEQRRVDIRRTGNNTVEMQKVADAFCQHFGVAKMHATQFYDRLPASRGSVGREVTFTHPWSEPNTGLRFTCAFLLLIDMIHFPPYGADPDDNYMLRLMDANELCIHLNMARAEIDGDLHKTNTFRIQLSKELPSWNLTEDRKRLVGPILNSKGIRYANEFKIAAGGRLSLPFLPLDQGRLDHVPLKTYKALQKATIFDSSWSIVDVSQMHFTALAEEDKKAAPPPTTIKFDRILQSSRSGDDGCIIVVKGKRSSSNGEGVLPEDVDIAQAMTPPFEPTCNRFDKVIITRAAYREVPGGLTDIALVFASRTHAATA